MHPLSKLLSEVEMANVFPAVNEIWKLHEQFLATLEATMQTEDLTKSGTERRKLAEIFSELASNCEKVYSPFLNQFQQASLVLKRLMENDPFKVGLAVESICSPRSSGISGLKYLGELMITPMQRLPRYELLFKVGFCFVCFHFVLTLLRFFLGAGQVHERVASRLCQFGKGSCRHSGPVSGHQ